MLRYLNKIYNKFFDKDYYYLYSMSIVHFILIIYGFLGISGYNTNVFYTLSLMGNHTDILSLYSGIQNILYSYLLIILIFIIDIAFLIILMLEFKWLRFNYKKILFIELILITISFIYPFFRDVMFFLSFNSIQIYIVYRILIKNIWFLKFPFLFVSYIFIIKLLLFPIIELYKISMIVRGL